MKKCEKGNCASIDYGHYKSISEIWYNTKEWKKDWKNKSVRKIKDSENFVEDDQDFCDSCLLNEYNIDVHHDSGDRYGMGTEYVEVDKVLEVIRCLRKK